MPLEESDLFEPNIGLCFTNSPIMRGTNGQITYSSTEHGLWSADGGLGTQSLITLESGHITSETVMNWTIGKADWEVRLFESKSTKVSWIRFNSIKLVISIVFLTSWLWLCRTTSMKLAQCPAWALYRQFSMTVLMTSIGWKGTAKHDKAWVGKTKNKSGHVCSDVTILLDSFGLSSGSEGPFVWSKNSDSDFYIILPFIYSFDAKILVMVIDINIFRKSIECTKKMIYTQSW